MSHLLSQREAARVWGVGRATLQRAISAGELSVSSEKLIDPAEMLRVYGEPKRNSGPAQSRQTGPLGPADEPPLNRPAQAAQAAQAAHQAILEATVEARDREIALLKANLEDLRSQVRLLTHEMPEKKRRWWIFS